LRRSLLCFQLFISDPLALNSEILSLEKDRYFTRGAVLPYLSLSDCGSPAHQEVKKEKDDARDKHDVNQTRGDVKCEKAKQPKYDQNCGDDPKHVFISCSARDRSCRAPRSMMMSDIKRHICPLRHTFAGCCFGRAEETPCRQSRAP
jgi:hypothetical protein